MSPQCQIKLGVRMLLLFVGFAFLGLMAMACAPAAPTGAPPAAVTAAVAATAAPTTAAGPTRGGKVIIALSQSPATLNWMFGSQTAMEEVLEFVIEGMTRVLPDGTRVAQLAKQVPSIQNGGVSADGKTITYHLLDGVLWSDGTPLSCDDVKFTWQAVTTKGVGVIAPAGYSEVDAVECPDPLTAVIKYKNFFAPYLTIFNAFIPKSAGDIKDIKNWAYNRKPIGTGPFKVDEWVTDDHITLSRNESYREKGKPYLDQIVIRIVPSVDVAKQLVISGEADIMWNNTEADIPELQKTPAVKYNSALLVGGERLFLNLAENKDGSDPSKPHAILGDVRVRQAIEYGINKQRIIDKILFGLASPGTSELNTGPFACPDIKPIPYDSEKAKALLTEAGWVPGPDGIRVAKGAKFAPDGTRLRLKYSTTTGTPYRENGQVLILEDMKAIGVEMFIENGPSALVIGNWADGSPRARGNFDIVEYNSNAGVDVNNQMTDMLATKTIPSSANTGGRNYSRFSDPKVDALLAQAASDPDFAKRKELYCQVARTAKEQVPMIFLYHRSRINSYRDRVQGFDTGNAFQHMAWNVTNWSVK